LKRSDVLFRVTPARTLLAAPDVDAQDLTIMGECAELIHCDAEPVGGFAGRQ